MKFREYILNEGGYSRLMQVMSGLVPTVKTFAVITWENPMGKKLSLKFNKQANERLKDVLKRGNFSFRHIKGRYNDFENPFIIFNINLSTAKNLGFENNEFKQDSILFGKRYEDRNELGVIVKMVYNDNRKPEVRRIWNYLDKKTDDFYSEYKGRKFEIPFFDDESKHIKFKNGKKRVIEDYNVYTTNDFAELSINKLNKMVDKLIEENRSGRSLYEHRGLLHLKLNKLCNINKH